MFQSIHREEKAISYEATMFADTGESLLDLSSFYRMDVALKLGDTSALSLVVPYSQVRGSQYLSVDNILLIKRTNREGTEDLLGPFFLRAWDIYDTGEGRRLVLLKGVGMEDLLQRRIIAYKATTAQSSIEGEAADDALKRLIRENLGSSATDSDRDISSLLFVEGDSGEGPIMDKRVAYQNLLKAADKIVEYAREAEGGLLQGGQEVFWTINVVNVDPLKLFFRTSVGYPGRDLSLEGDKLYGSAIFSPDHGNLISPRISFDYRNEVNYAYIGHTGEGEDRKLYQLANTSRIGASLYNRREVFVDARNEADQASAEDRGQQALEEGKGTLSFSGKLIDTEQTPYGFWKLGDLVTIQYAGMDITSLVKVVRISVNSEGEEDIQSKVELVRTTSGGDIYAWVGTPMISAVSEGPNPKLSTGL